MKNKKVEGRQPQPPSGEKREGGRKEPGNVATTTTTTTSSTSTPALPSFAATTTTTTKSHRPPPPPAPPPLPPSPEDTAETDESFSSSLAPIVASHLNNEDSASISPPTSSLFSSSASASSKEEEDKKRSALSVMRQPMPLGVVRPERCEDGVASRVIQPGSSQQLLLMDDLKSAQQGLSISERYRGTIRRTMNEDALLPHPELSSTSDKKNKADGNDHGGESSPVQFQNTFSLSDEEPVVPRTNDTFTRGVVLGTKDGREEGGGGSYHHTKSLATTVAPTESRSTVIMDQFQGRPIEELASAFDDVNDGKLSSMGGNIFLMSPDRRKQQQQVVSEALIGRGDQRIQFSKPAGSNSDPGESDSRVPGSYAAAHQSSCSSSSPSSDEKQGTAAGSVVKKNPQILPDIPFFKNTSLVAKHLPNEASNDGVQAAHPHSNKDVDFDKVLLDYENDDLAEVDMGLAHLPFVRKRKGVEHEHETRPQLGETQPENDTSQSSIGNAHGGEDYESPQLLSQASRKATGPPIRTLWDERYEELRDYRVEHGHCTVPFSYSQKPLLASWVKRQRYQYKCKMRGEHSHLTDERQAMLDDLGFVWDTHVGAWDEKFSELEDFYRLNGHCQVPIRNKELNAWCKRQRRQYKQYLEAGGDLATMTADRVRRLSSIHFQWQSSRPASETGNETATRETVIQEASSTGQSRKRKDHRGG